MLRTWNKVTKLLPALLGILLVVLSTFAPFALAQEFVISDNGSGSGNEVSVQTSITTTVEQTNQADVTNNVTTDATTGENTVSGNSGDAEITTGDIDSNLSIENNVNSSAVETPCCPSDTNATISGNGSDSENAIAIDSINQTNISINQNATISNTVNGSANTGENNANNNNGNVSINTGDITVWGGITNGPINVENVVASSGTGNVSARILENGANSTNTLALFLNSLTTVNVNHNATVRNDVSWDLNTGRNNANGNNGDVSITTGDIFFDLFIKNGPINVGGVIIRCCPVEIGGPEKPGDGEEEEDGEENGGPEDGDGEEGEDGERDNDGDGGEAAGGPHVLGLSVTAGENLNTLLFWVGLVMIASGLRFVGQQLAYEKKKRR